MWYLLNQLKPFLLRYRNDLFLGILFLILSNFFAILPAQYIKTAIDETLNHILSSKTFASSWIFLLKYSGILIGLAFLRGFFLFLVRQKLIVMSRKIEGDQRKTLFSHLLHIPQQRFQQFQTGDLMARLTEDISQVRMFTGPGIMYTLNTTILFCMVAFIMFWKHPALTLFCLLPLPLLTLLIYFVHAKINQLSDRLQQQLSRITAFTQEIFSNIRLIKGAIKEGPLFSKFKEQSDEYYQKAMDLNRLDALFYPSVAFLVGVSMLLSVWIGGSLVIQKQLTIGTIAEYIVYIQLLTWPIASLGWITSMIQRAVASQKRLNQLMNLPVEPKIPPKALSNFHIAFQNVSFIYPGTGIIGVQNLTFHLKEGQRLGIIGTIGSGKTTIVNLLLGIYQPTSGKILIGNTPLNQIPSHQLYRMISIVTQTPLLFSDTIYNNVAYAKPNASKEEIIEALQFAQFYDEILSFPKKLDTLIGERGITLSGGQKQRLALSRAYLKKAPILILDDPLSAVDTETEAKILSALQTTSYSPTLIITSHRLSAVRNCHLILVLHKGKIIEMGTHENLLQNNKLYAKLYQYQTMETVG